MFGSFGFPGFGFHGILPSYYPYLVAMGLGRCNCRPAPQPFIPCAIPFPVIRFW